MPGRAVISAAVTRPGPTGTGKRGQAGPGGLGQSPARPDPERAEREWSRRKQGRGMERVGGGAHSRVVARRGGRRKWIGGTIIWFRRPCYGTGAEGLWRCINFHRHFGKETLPGFF